MSLHTIDPATGEPIATHDETTAAELEALLDRARERATAPAAVPAQERAASLRDLAAALPSDADALAALATREMGKPLTESYCRDRQCWPRCR